MASMSRFCWMASKGTLRDSDASRSSAISCTLASRSSAGTARDSSSDALLLAKPLNACR